MGTAIFVQCWYLLLVGGVSGHRPSRCERVAPGLAAGKFLAGDFGVAAGFSVASRAVGWPKILAGPAGSQHVCSQHKLAASSEFQLWLGDHLAEETGTGKPASNVWASKGIRPVCFFFAER